jgi:putative ABC transport system ATP-binding protein
MEAEPLVKIRQLSKTYARAGQPVEVLRGINLDIHRGSFLCLMGPSGSGKSTLLHLLGGLDFPSAGSIVVQGEALHQMSSSRLARWRARHVGFVFQSYNLMPALSALKNVELPLLMTSLSAAQRRRHAEVALELVGLKERTLHRPAELSGGQEQRVTIARALVTDPDLLICDEPTGDLDRASADDILGLLLQLNVQQGKTIVMVTHDPKAADFADHVLHLDKGLLANAGAPDAKSETVLL